MGLNSSKYWFPKLENSAPVAIELCSGLGAIGIGLRSLGIHVAHAYDDWSDAVEIYNHNATEPIAKQCDLLSETGFRAVKRDSKRIGGVDLLAAGPPCKGFSQLRNGQHYTHVAYKHNRVLAAMPDYVAAIRPRYVLIENVPDLVRHRKGNTLQNLISRLERPGPRGLRYRVEFNIFDSALYGTPQARRRVLIYCVRSDSDSAALPEPEPDLSRLYSAIRHRKQIPDVFLTYKAILEDPRDLKMTPVAHALSDLPALGPGRPEEPRAYSSRASTSYQRLMRQGAPRKLSNTQTPAIRSDTIRRLNSIPPGGSARDIPEHLLNGLSRRFGSAYRRLHPDAPSTALSTKYDCVYHFSSCRSLSVREYARIQGLPDFVEFPETMVCRRHAYEMIGNSVPPLLIKGVMGEILGS